MAHVAVSGGRRVFPFQNIFVGMSTFLIALLALIVIVTVANADKQVEVAISGLSKAGKMPIIGILTMPIDPASDSLDVSFIDTSYVKFLHGGGATVVPILFNSTTEEIETQMELLDGVFFTGGAAMPTSFPRFYTTAKLLYSLVMEQGKTLWGTCLGFQMISDIVAGQVADPGILGNYPSMNLALSLNFTEYGEKQSQMFSHLPPKVRELFSQQALTENWHNYGVGLDVFKSNMEPKGYRIVSTNIDTNGVEFVSTFEHEKSHIFATQWHPEANQYDPDPKNGANIVHSMDATTAMNYMANFLIQNARTRSTKNMEARDVDASMKKDTQPQQHNRRLGHQSDLPNAIENYPVRAVVSEEDTAFQYYFI